MSNIEELKALITDQPWGLEARLKAYIQRLESEEKGGKLKTEKQRNSLHLGLTWLANHLNEIGKDMRVVLKPTVAIPWTMLSCKEFLYKPILKGYANKDSTEDMDKHEPGQVWDIMMKHLGENHQVEYVPWPDRSAEREQLVRDNRKEIMDSYPTQDSTITHF
jgi:hypothetical protein